MAQNLEHKSQNHPEQPSGPSHSTAPEADVSAARLSAEPPAPSAEDRPDDDLPDIVDLVMEMGRTTEELPAVAPSSAPTVAIPRLPAHLERLADHARKYVEAASSANTRRAYASDWKHFCAWARRQNLDVSPPDPQIVGLYMGSGQEQFKILR